MNNEEKTFGDSIAEWWENGRETREKIVKGGKILLLGLGVGYLMGRIGEHKNLEDQYKSIMDKSTYNPDDSDMEDYIDEKLSDSAYRQKMMYACYERECLDDCESSVEEES